MTLDTDIRVRSVQLGFTPQPFRVPLKFGTGVIDSLSLLTASVEVIDGRGTVATGVGCVLLSHLWAFPGGSLGAEEKDSAMRRVAEAYAGLIQGKSRRGHPIDLFMEAEPDLFAAAARISPEMPRLAALVAASPIDCAVHDAFGRVNGMCSYDGCGPDFLKNDLSHYLGKEYRGVYPSECILPAYTPRLPVFHLVGGLDPLTPAETSPDTKEARDPIPGSLEGATGQPHRDADKPMTTVPSSLGEWIRREGIFCFKLKLRGNDLDWDVNRCRDVAAECRANLEYMGSDRFYFSIDTNECCESPEYCIEFLDRLRLEDRQAHDAILYLEQPTGRDLAIDDHDMRPLASRKPVLADETVSTLADLDRALELGWSGIALKVCKGLSPSLLYVAKARREGLLYSVQDLTNPGCSLVQSVGFAARIEPIMGVECNSRQFIPDANARIESRHPGIVHPDGGYVVTESLDPLGLGCSPEF